MSENPQLVLSSSQKAALLHYFPQGIVAFDFETTGLAPMVDSLLELAAVKLTPSGNLETYEQLLNPGVAIPPITTAIHNITDDMVANSPFIEQTLPDFLNFLGDYPLVAHSAKYDASFLTFNIHALCLPMPRNDIYCTCALARAAKKGVENYKLVTLIEHFALKATNSHRALDDSFACLLVMAELCQTIKDEQNAQLLKDKGHLFNLGQFAKKGVYEVPERLKQISRHIMTDVIVEINYSGGSVPNQWRPITPLLFLPHPHGMGLQAVCLLTGDKKTFLLKRIKNVREITKDKQKEYRQALDNLKDS